MKRFYKLTIHTSDIFNFTTAVAIKQYDPKPEILAFYDSIEGQLCDLRISCTPNEALVIKVALSDYILRMVQIDVSNKELSFWERVLLV